MTQFRRLEKQVPNFIPFGLIGIIKHLPYPREQGGECLFELDCLRGTKIETRDNSVFKWPSIVLLLDPDMRQKKQNI